MKESINNSLILTLVITFLFIFVILFAGSTAYTKAFKVKNRIISTIERHEDIVLQNNGNPGVNHATIQNEIRETMRNAGYKIVANNDNLCRNAMTARFRNSHNQYRIINTGSSDYRYCIARFVTGSEMGGEYYAVIAYMYFEVPLIGARLEFPVYGETKVLGKKY